MKPLIHIYGASGSGTSTLGRYLAEQFHYAFLDSDDYFWLPTDPKFTTKRPIAERVPLMRQDIAAAENGAVAVFVEEFTCDRLARRLGRCVDPGFHAGGAGRDRYAHPVDPHKTA